MTDHGPSAASGSGAAASADVAGADFHSAWVAALDELELDVAVAEALICADHAAADMPAPSVSGEWAPPGDIGPIPGDLRKRAEQIHRRQILAGTALAQAMAGNRRHSALITRLDHGSDGGDRPAYVDWAL